jgi:hypothetical protein
MLVSYSLPAISATFDDSNLVACRFGSDDGVGLDLSRGERPHPLDGALGRF